MDTVYISVDSGFEREPRRRYSSSIGIMEKLNRNVDLLLVHPGDYMDENGRVRKAYRFVDGDEIREDVGEHEISGSMFIPYGLDEPRCPGLAFARRQFDFLKGLKKDGRFEYFFNNPEAEEMTMKDALVWISKGISLGIASTFRCGSVEEVENLLSKCGKLVLKPVLGSNGIGVRLIENIDDWRSLDCGDFQWDDFVLQEFLSGVEKRIAVLDGKFIYGRMRMVSVKPWETYHGTGLYHDVYEPSEEEVEKAIGISRGIGATIAGIDFIGEKVNEINGTGTGLLAYDEEGRVIFDHTSVFVDHVMKTLERGG